MAVALFLGGYKVPFNLGGDTIFGQFFSLAHFLLKHFYFITLSFGSDGLSEIKSRSANVYMLEILNSNCAF